MSKYFRTQFSQPDDAGKTWIRLEKSLMQKLGIENGDVVKIIGNKTAYAFCFPVDESYNSQNEVNFVCLEESSSQVPVVKLSDLTYGNLRNFHVGNLVEIEKARAIPASKMAIMPQRTLGSPEIKTYDLGWLEDKVVVTKGNHISKREPDPKNFHSFFVVDAIPSSDAWIIDKNTPIEIVSKIPENTHTFVGGSVIDAGNLNDVIPLVKRITKDDFEATLSAIEVYDRCMRILVYIKDKIQGREQWTSGLCTPQIKVWDNLGNHYEFSNYGGRGGGTQFGSALWSNAISRPYFSEVSLVFSPTLDRNAQEIII